MDQRLVAWGRAVKSRAVKSGVLAADRPSPPPLWLFTDPVRTPDLVGLVSRLPRGLCGVVFRHDGAPGRAALGRRLRRACTVRRCLLVSAGPAVAGAGTHGRGGRGRRRRGPLTASAHGAAELMRARRAGAAVIFLSPVLPTASHPGAPSLGIRRFAALSGRRPGVFALGGLDGGTVRGLPRWCRGIGAIGAFVD